MSVFSCIDLYELQRKADVYERAASTHGEHLLQFAAALRTFAERMIQRSQCNPGQCPVCA